MSAAKRRISLLGLLAAGALVLPGLSAFAPSAAATTAVTSDLATSKPAITEPPSAADIVAGRFVHRGELDDGALAVSPAPATKHPPMNMATAVVLLKSDPLATGSQTGLLLGFGLATIRPGLGVKVDRAAAWVGLMWGGAFSCPAMTIPSGPTTTVAAPPTPGYRVVIMLNTRKVFDYESRGSACGGPPSGPTAQTATETVSVPWTLISLEDGTVSYRYEVPSCEQQVLPSASTGGDTITGIATLTVELALPFNRPSCPQTWLNSSAAVDPPDGPGAPQPTYTTVNHGSTGPVGSF
jgi:hypothetical protein